MFAVIWFQKFSLQSVLRTEVFKPASCVAILRETKHRSIIFQVNSHAERHGVQVGHTVSQAIAKCANLKVRPRKPLAEKSAKDTLFSCLYQVTPLIEETREDAYTLQFPETLSHEQIHDQVQQLLKSLKHLGFFPQIGVAKASNWADFAAKCAQPFLWVSNHEDFFKNVSINVGVDDEQMREILSQWGILTLGAFADLPKQAIARRLGTKGLCLWQSLHNPQLHILDVKEPPVKFESRVEVEHDIVTLEPLLFILNRSIQQLCVQLDCAYQQAKAIILELILENKNKHKRIFKLPEPTTNQQKLRRLLETHLEHLRTESAIQAIILKAIPIDAISKQNQLFQHSVKDSWKFASTIHQLIGLVGSENVGTPVLKNDHQPDSFTIDALPQVLENKPHSGNAPKALTALHLQRYRPPIPIAVELASGRPILLRSNELEGSVQNFRGPWIQSGTWWDNRHWKRVEWDIELENEALYRIVYIDGEWFIDGSYG